VPRMPRTLAGVLTVSAWCSWLCSGWTSSSQLRARKAPSHGMAFKNESTPSQSVTKICRFVREYPETLVAATPARQRGWTCGASRATCGARSTRSWCSRTPPRRRRPKHLRSTSTPASPGKAKQTPKRPRCAVLVVLGAGRQAACFHAKIMYQDTKALARCNDSVKGPLP